MTGANYRKTTKSKRFLFFIILLIIELPGYTLQQSYLVKKLLPVNQIC